MERVIRRFQITWLLLLGGALLLQYVGWSKPAYWLFVPVVMALPLLLLAQLGHLVLGAREIWWRIRRLRRAHKWKRERPVDTSWMHSWLDDDLR